ncbi:MAG: protoporphyrinogen/coproporphyrinogen oxidase [Solirubrobacteraceae bacterium]|nr:protoporphyrinogen/coproporphyrinogen oxidase [Solirubrobacteraceae bacterium]
MAKRVVVVGAGVSGLAAAFRLQEQGFDVIVLEAEDHVGGKTAATRDRDGWTLNTGATVLAGSYKATLAIARDAGLESEIIRVPTTIGVVRDGRVHWLRGSGVGALVDFARTPLISGRSKLLLAKAGLDAARAWKKAGYDRPQLRAELDTESVAAYCDRRLNPEIRDNLLGPVLGGLFGFRGDTMSVADVFFTLNKILLGGVLGYRGGIDFFARGVAAKLADVRTGAAVSRVERSAGGVRVSYVQDGETHTEAADGAVLAIAAPFVPEMFPELDPGIQGILNEGMEQANFFSIRLGLSSRPALEGLLAVAPSGALGGVATVMLEHNIAEGNCPPGKGLVGVLLYHEWITPRLSLSDDEILEQVLPDVERVVPGITELVEFAAVTRWQPGALLVKQGTHKLMAEIDRRVNPRDTVQLAGDYLSIPSINGSVVTGETAATRLAAALSRS